MEPIQETVTMVVKIPKSVRSKLGRVKGIYGCDSLACTVSSVIEDIVIPDLLRSIADREVVTHVPTQSDPIPTKGSLYGEEEIAMVSFCNRLKERLGYDEINQIDGMIDADVIKIIDTTKSTISPAGEIPGDIEWED